MLNLFQHLIKYFLSATNGTNFYGLINKNGSGVYHAEFISASYKVN